MSTCFIQLMICYLLINDIFSLSPSTNILEIKRVVQCEQKTQQQNSLFLNSDQRSLEDCLDLESLLDDSESLLGDVSSEEEPEDLFLENILEETALKFLETTPYDKTSIETIMNENLEIDMDKLNQLPSPLKKQYTLLVTGQSFHEVGFKRIMKWGIPAVYVPAPFIIYYIINLMEEYQSSSFSFALLSLTFILACTFVGLIVGTLIFERFYQLTRLKRKLYPHYLSKYKKNTHKIQYKRAKNSSQVAYISQKTTEKLQLHLSVSPIGSYTVLKGKRKTSLLIAKINQNVCLILNIPSSKAENLSFVKDQLEDYLDTETILSPFSISPHQNLKGEKIISGAGVGFELQGSIYFYQKPSQHKTLSTCDCLDIPERGYTQFPSLFKTAVVPRVCISYDMEHDLELITDPILYSIPSKRESAQTLIEQTIQTWKGIEQRVSLTLRPILEILDEITEKTQIIYKRSEDENNEIDPQELFLFVKNQERVRAVLQGTYSIPIETLSSPLLAIYDNSIDLKNQSTHYNLAIKRAQRMVQTNLMESLLAQFDALTAHSFKQLEGFFTALFYVLEIYKTPCPHQYQLIRGHTFSAKYLFDLYIKHSLYDLLTLLPKEYQDFLSELSLKPDNILYTSIAEHLSVKLNESRYLASWYTSTWGWGSMKDFDSKTDYSLAELLDILFQRKEKEKKIWFFDDHSLDFVRNKDDSEKESKRLLLEIRTLSMTRDFAGEVTRDIEGEDIEGEVQENMNDFIEMAGYLSPYNTPEHLFKSRLTAYDKFKRKQKLLKSA